MQTPDPNRISADNWKERAAIGFLFGAVLGFGGALYYGGWQDALTAGFVCGFLLAGISVCCSKRGFEVLIEFVRHLH